MRRGLSCVVGGVLLAACAAPVPPPVVDTGVLGAAWAGAVTAGGASCGRLIAAPLAYVCTNLSRLGRVALAAGPAGAPRADGSWVQPVTATWSAPGEQRVATQAWFVRLAAFDGGARLVAASTPDGGSAPLWALERIRVRPVAGGVLIAGERDPGLWPDALAAAVSEVAAADLGELVVDAGPVVVELPGRSATLAAMTGVGGPSFAALARPWGDGPASAVHVLVDPTFAPRDFAAARFLLTHEAVHVKTASPRWRAPLWVAEGIAEHVAAAAQPTEAPAPGPGVPAALPGAADFRAGAPGAGVAYARARVAIEALVAHLGWPATRTAIAAWAAGHPPATPTVAALTAWWQDRLR